MEKILGKAEKIAAGIDHPRAGDLIAIAAENAWFTYYYWLDDARAPDFCAHCGHPSQTRLRPGGIISRPENSAAEIKNRVAAAAKETWPADVDGRDSARRDVGERFARSASGE